MRSGAMLVLCLGGFAALAVGCGNGGSGSAKLSGGGASKNASTSPVHSLDDLSPDMVSAVSTARSATPIDLKFSLSARPIVGKPVDIQLAVIPASDVEIEHIRLSFQAVDGLELLDTRPIEIDQPAAGIPQIKTITVIPHAAGVGYLSAGAVVDDSQGSIARQYLIPLIISKDAG